MTFRPLKVTGWLVLIAVVVLATIILVAIGRGYSYDWHNGRLKLNGLVIITSQPDGADISIDGKMSRHKTPYRTTLEAGEYTLDVTKYGYRPWTKHIAINASQVTWAQYILLLPNNLPQSNWFTSDGFKLLSTSRDHHHFAVVDNKSGGVLIFNNNDHKPKTLYTPTAPVVSGPVETVDALAWSGDASRVLVTSQAAGKRYQRLVTVSDSSVLKLTEQYGLDMPGLQFNPANARQLVWLAPEGLRRLDVGSQSLTAVLADKVASYALDASNHIVYVQSTDLGKGLFSMNTDGSGKQQLVQSLVDSSGYRINFGSYLGDDRIAVLPSSSKTLTMYADLGTANPTSKVIAASADEMQFSPDGRFLLYRDGQKLASYDLELKRSYHFTPSPTKYHLVTWFDTYHVLAVNDASVSLVEFDGANPAKLTTKFSDGLISFTSNQHEVLVAQPGKDTKVSLVGLTIKP